MMTTVQDLGRWGFQAYGVPVSGAMDPVAHRRANQLLGNDDDAATLEVTLMGPHVRFDSGCVFAVTGADFQLKLDGVDIPADGPTAVSAGAVLSFGERRRGARAYLAVANGIDVPMVLGSRSTHTLSHMGGYHGRALRAGDVISIADRVAGTPRRRVDIGYAPERFPQGRAKLRILPADTKLAGSLLAQRFRVSVNSNRMGYRLEGGRVAQPPAGELVSTAVPTGAVQVPPSGEPILLMNDHATTGGYAIAGVVITADLWIAGQLAPGDWIDFEECDIRAAEAELHRLEAIFAAR